MLTVTYATCFAKDSSVATQRTQRAYREIPFSMNALRAALKTSHGNCK